MYTLTFYFAVFPSIKFVFGLFVIQLGYNKYQIHISLYFKVSLRVKLL